MKKYDDVSYVLEKLGEAQDAENDSRRMAKEARVFCNSKTGQWEQEWYEACQGKPRYTFDQVTPIVDQIAGDIANTDFDLKAVPSGGGASQQLAEFRDGLIRNIENISNAKEVYNNAAANVVEAGIDHWLVTTGYVDEYSFDQDILIEPIFNSEYRVWFDPNSAKRDRSDSRYAFLLSAITKDEYKYRFPDGGCMSVSDNDRGYVFYDKAEQVIIGHFFCVKQKGTKTLVKMNNEEVYEVNDDFEKVKDELAMVGITVAEERELPDMACYVRKFDGSDWLGDWEETVFDSVPIVPVYGKFKVIENKPVYSGVVTKLMDAQRVLNYSLSRQIEEGALAPRAKFWMTKAQAKGHTTDLATLNTNNKPVQFYNADPEAPNPPPQSGGAAINEGLAVVSSGMRELIGQTAGIFAAGMGDNPNLQSGIAIGKLQKKTNNISLPYMRAMEVAVRRTGMLVNQALDKVYTKGRQVRIMNEDGSFEIQTVMKPIPDLQTGEIVYLNDLTVGKYDILCKAGPSYDSRQSEAVEGILSIAQYDPTILELGGDIIMKNVGGMDKVAERKRVQLLNAGLIPEEQMTPDEQQKMAQAAQNQQPDAAMALAQAEQTKAEAEVMKANIIAQKNEIEMAKLQQKVVEQREKLAIDIERLRIERDKMMTEAEKKRLEMQAQIMKLDREGKRDELDAMMRLADLEAKQLNDAVNRLNKQADTLLKLRDSLGADAIITPTGMIAYQRQTEEVMGAQDGTREPY